MEETLQRNLFTVASLQHYQGYSYLIQAVMLANENPERLQSVCKEIYRPIARKYQTTTENVHRDIRTVRDAFMRSGGGKTLTELTGCQAWISQTPSPKELIGILACFFT